MCIESIFWRKYGAFFFPKKMESMRISMRVLCVFLCTWCVFHANRNKHSSISGWKPVSKEPYSVSKEPSTHRITSPKSDKWAGIGICGVYLDRYCIRIQWRNCWKCVIYEEEEDTCWHTDTQTLGQVLHQDPWRNCWKTCAVQAPALFT